MTEFQAFLLGLIQGLTEFLPVSSSGHLELGHHFLHVQNHDNLLFTVVVHAATVLSTLVVFRSDVAQLATSALKFRWDEHARYVVLLLLSAVPVAIVGLFFHDEVGKLFNENLLLVGGCLLVTATLLLFAHFRKKVDGKKIGFADSLLIGLAQAVAVLPGISRSGATIATGLLLQNDRKETARFSFLMVLLPIAGAVMLDLLKSGFRMDNEVGAVPLLIGFVTAFLSGLIACRWMIRLVSRGKLIYFSIYCFIVGVIAIFAA